MSASSIGLCKKMEKRDGDSKTEVLGTRTNSNSTVRKTHWQECASRVPHSECEDSGTLYAAGKRTLQEQNSGKTDAGLAEKNHTAEQRISRNV